MTEKITQLQSQMHTGGGEERVKGPKNCPIKMQ